MERTTRTQLHAFLLSFMGDNGERRALIENAFFSTPVINQIDWRGDAETFTTALITRLLRYGVVADERPALGCCWRICASASAQIGRRECRGDQCRDRR